ncbi:MAG: flavin reductase family protein [Clostridia bacterium]|nr:flavin reductase family protein [Clostridia bacterium]
MAKQVWKGSAVFGPLPPALVSCGDGETRNVLTVAWTGIVNSHPPMTYISVRPERYSYGIIDHTGEFVINFPTSALAAAADACGVLSGRKVDKAAKLGLTYEECEKVSAPAIAECPLSLECRVTEKKELGSHTMFLAEIVAVRVDERLIDSKGKLNLQQAGLISYQHGEYFATGGKRGEFGFSVKKKEKKK